MHEPELRVLVLTPDFPPAVGGIQLLVHRLVSEAKSASIRVVTLGSAGAAQWDAGPGRDLDVRRVAPGHRRRLAIVRLNLRAIREARSFRPHVVLAAHIVTSPAASLIHRLLGVPFALYLYAKEIGASPRLTAFGATRAAAIIAISRYTRDLALGVGAPADRIHLIQPGVDAAAAPLADRTREPLFVTVARLEDRYKGHDVLVRALPLVRARVPDARWIVVGSGSLERDIEQLAEAHGVRDAVCLRGSTSNQERDAWLDRALVFAMPSRLPAGGAAGEGFGIVFLEAGTHGIPVVAGSEGGALDAVVDGETGFLVNPRDHVAVADAITELLLDRERAVAMGEAGRRHAESFRWSSVADSIVALLGRIAPGQR